MCAAHDKEWWDRHREALARQAQDRELDLLRYREENGGNRVEQIESDWLKI
jgi:hypothetical protein